MAHQEGLTLFHRQCGERATDLFAPDDRFVESWMHAALGHVTVFNDQRPPLLTSSRASAPIGENAKEPWLERLALLVLGQGAVDSDERVLNGFFGVGAVDQHVEGKPEAARVVSVHEGGERADVPVARFADEEVTGGRGRFSANRRTVVVSQEAEGSLHWPQGSTRGDRWTSH